MSATAPGRWFGRATSELGIRRQRAHSHPLTQTRPPSPPKACCGLARRQAPARSRIAAAQLRAYLHLDSVVKIAARWRCSRLMADGGWSHLCATSLGRPVTDLMRFSALRVQVHAMRCICLFSANHNRRSRPPSPSNRLCKSPGSPSGPQILRSAFVPLIPDCGMCRVRRPSSICHGETWTPILRILLTYPNPLARFRHRVTSDCGGSSLACRRL